MTLTNDQLDAAMLRLYLASRMAKEFLRAIQDVAAQDRQPSVASLTAFKTWYEAMKPVLLQMLETPTAAPLGDQLGRDDALLAIRQLQKALPEMGTLSVMLKEIISAQSPRLTAVFHEWTPQDWTKAEAALTAKLLEITTAMEALP
jgi:hypothetical protein